MITLLHTACWLRISWTKQRFPAIDFLTIWCAYGISPATCPFPTGHCVAWWESRAAAGGSREIPPHYRLPRGSAFIFSAHIYYTIPLYTGQEVIILFFLCSCIVGLWGFVMFSIFFLSLYFSGRLLNQAWYKWPRPLQEPVPSHGWLLNQAWYKWPRPLQEPVPSHGWLLNQAWYKWPRPLQEPVPYHGRLLNQAWYKWPRPLQEPPFVNIAPPDPVSGKCNVDRGIRCRLDDRWIKSSADLYTIQWRHGRFMTGLSGDRKKTAHLWQN